LTPKDDWSYMIGCDKGPIMRDQMNNHEDAKNLDGEAVPTFGRKPYRRPELVKLGSLRDLTLKTNPGAANDGMPSKSAGRGGGYVGSRRS
jgi:hypothetical protein